MKIKMKKDWTDDSNHQVKVLKKDQEFEALAYANGNLYAVNVDEKLVYGVPWVFVSDVVEE